MGLVSVAVLTNQTLGFVPSAPFPFFYWGPRWVRQGLCMSWAQAEGTEKVIRAFIISHVLFWGGTPQGWEFVCAWSVRHLCQKVNLEDCWAKLVKNKLLGLWTFAILVMWLLFPFATQELFLKTTWGCCANSAPPVTQPQSTSFAGLEFNQNSVISQAKAFDFDSCTRKCILLSTSVLFTSPSWYFPFSASHASWEPISVNLTGIFFLNIFIFFNHCRPASLLVNTWNWLPKQSLNLAHTSGRHLCWHIYFHKQSYKACIALDLNWGVACLNVFQRKH